MSGLFQPLAGALLELETRQFLEDTFGVSYSIIALNPSIDVDTLSIAAHGPPAMVGSQSLVFVLNDDQYPASVSDEGNTFVFPTFPSERNVVAISMQIPGISSWSNCTQMSANASPVNGSSELRVAFSTSAGCQANLTIDRTLSNQQQGIVGINAGSCGFDANTPTEFLPVVVWLFQDEQSQSANHNVTQAVICQPSIQLLNLGTDGTVTTGANPTVYLDFTHLGFQAPYTVPNNITGPPVNGRAYNGHVPILFFSNFTNIPSEAATQISAIPSQLADSISQYASVYTPGCMHSTVSKFCNGQISGDMWQYAVDQVYRYYLASFASTAYLMQTFLDDNAVWTTTPATLTIERSRVVVDPLAAHSLAVLLIIVGLAGLAIHLQHVRARRHIHLTHQPSTIASIIALSARSGLAGLLDPEDDEDTIRRKLAPLRFGLDAGTGAIVVTRADNSEDIEKNSYQLPELEFQAGNDGGLGLKM
ncbi:hypothetical protein BC835DRAFT_1415565 [Cytidiella melzeri]|nr:hypothetical protein BC835DRAFT_1415565 [Cytidiella melzeri]